MCKSLQPSIQDKQFRRALGQFSTGVAVVTTCNELGEPLGMTINSFSSVSLRPRLVSWCIDRSAASYMDFSRCAKFVISILGADQQALAQRFATRGADKFAGIPWQPYSPPVIPGASAWFECDHYQQFLLGDHLMLVGHVQRFDIQQLRPLVFAQGRFHNLPETQQAAA